MISTPLRVLFPLMLAGTLLACNMEPSAFDEAEVAETDSNQWLREADSDRLRFARMESYLGGFSAAMWQVGERWERTHAALSADNLELAEYHWEKIVGAIEGGIMKRPGRRENARAMFLDAIAEDVATSFASGDGSKAWDGFRQAREACMACHAAEDVPFMNAQPLFTELRAP